MQDQMSKEAWIALVSVTAGDDTSVLDGRPGAYVNAIAMAYDESNFVEQIHSAVDELGLSVEQIEDIERFDTRISAYRVDDELHELALKVEIDEGVKFGSFHTYDCDTDIN